MEEHMKKHNFISFIVSLSLTTFAVQAFAQSTQINTQDEINRVADEIEPLLEDESDFVVLKPANSKSKAPRKKVVTQKKVRSHNAPAGRTRIQVADNATTSRYSVVEDDGPSLDISMPAISIAPVIGFNSYSLDGNVNGAKFKKESSLSGGVSILLGSGDLQVETGLQVAKHSTTLENKIYTYYYYTSYISNDMTYDLTYLEAPLALRYKFHLNDRMNVFARAGVQFAYLQDAKISTGNNYIGTYQLTDADAKSSFNELETRGLISAGGAYKFTRSMSLAVQVEYQKSLTKTSNAVKNNYGSTTNTELTSSILGIGAALIWEI